MILNIYRGLEHVVSIMNLGLCPSCILFMPFLAAKLIATKLAPFSEIRSVGFLNEAERVYAVSFTRFRNFTD